jgi:pyrroline-5-carboxylate reductase
MKIAIIGAGNMGGAIARGLATGSRVEAKDIMVANPTTAKLDKLKSEHPDINVTTDNAAAAAWADMVIVAVKPWLMGEVLKDLGLKQERHTLVSVAAGVEFAQLGQMTGTQSMPMFRIIPNTAISQKESMSLVASKNATKKQEEEILALFGELGTCIVLPEKNFAAGTALTSCGIAYVLKYMQAAMQAGTEMGLKPADSMKMVAQTMKGAAELILRNDTHPALEIDKVTTPGGLTIKGVNTLEQYNFSYAVIKAIEAGV